MERHACSYTVALNLYQQTRVTRAILFHNIYVSLSPAYSLYPLSLYNQCWIAKIVLKQRLITIFGGLPLNP